MRIEQIRNGGTEVYLSIEDLERLAQACERGSVEMPRPEDEAALQTMSAAFRAAAMAAWAQVELDGRQMMRYEERLAERGLT
jgi:hypothetical protein